MWSITCEDIRGLCIKNQWFTCGSNEQYRKLFYALESGCSPEEIVTIILLCSDDCWDRRGIRAMLLPYYAE